MLADALGQQRPASPPLTMILLDRPAAVAPAGSRLTLLKGGEAGHAGEESAGGRWTAAGEAAFIRLSFFIVHHRHHLLE